MHAAGGLLGVVEGLPAPVLPPPSPVVLPPVTVEFPPPPPPVVGETGATTGVQVVVDDAPVVPTTGSDTGFVEFGWPFATPAGRTAEPAQWVGSVVSTVRPGSGAGGVAVGWGVVALGFLVAGAVVAVDVFVAGGARGRRVTNRLGKLGLQVGRNGSHCDRRRGA